MLAMNQNKRLGDRSFLTGQQRGQERRHVGITSHTCTCTFSQRHFRRPNPSTRPSKVNITSQLPSLLHLRRNHNETFNKHSWETWVLLFHVSMDRRNVLETPLHTRFAIFLYTFQLETAILTKRVLLDAADAERSVLLQCYTSDPSFYIAIMRMRILFEHQY